MRRWLRKSPWRLTLSQSPEAPIRPSAAVLAFVLMDRFAVIQNMVFPRFQRRVPSHPQGFWLAVLGGTHIPVFCPTGDRYGLRCGLRCAIVVALGA